MQGLINRRFKMKKLIIALVATATIAQADISVNLFTAYGFTDDSNADSVLLNTGETATETTGTETEEKGVEELIEAFISLDLSDFKLKILGTSLYLMK